MNRTTSHYKSEISRNGQWVDVTRLSDGAWVQLRKNSKSDWRDFLMVTGAEDDNEFEQACDHLGYNDGAAYDQAAYNRWVREEA